MIFIVLLIVKILVNGNDDGQFCGKLVVGLKLYQEFSWQTSLQVTLHVSLATVHGGECTVGHDWPGQHRRSGSVNARSRCQWVAAKKSDQQEISQ